jgi:hypothetical protein
MTHHRIGGAAAAAMVVAAVALPATLNVVPGVAAPRLHAKAAPPKFTVRVFGAPGQVRGTYVSHNGKYIAGEDDPSLYSTATGKKLGQVIPDSGTAEGIGVTDAGVLYGVGPHGKDSMLNPLDGTFRFAHGHLTWLTPVNFGTKYFGCASPVDLSVRLNDVNSTGRGVGFESGNCGAGNVLVAVYYDGHTLSTTGDGKPADTSNDAHVLTQGGLTVGNTEGPDGNGLAVWFGTHVEPELLSTYTGIPGSDALIAGRDWNVHGHFIGDHLNGDTLGEQLFNGKKAIQIPGTAGASQTFSPVALGDNDMVVGGGSEDSQAAKIWTAATGVRTVASLSGSKVNLNSAFGIDGVGDIFGISLAEAGPRFFEATPLGSAPPSVSIKTPKAGHSYTKGAVVKASYSCKAGKGSSLVSCKGTVADHHKISTKKVGKHTFTVVAKDADGQTHRRKVHYRVHA